MWLTSWLRNLITSRAHRTGSRSASGGVYPRRTGRTEPPRFRPRLEGLEDRWLPSFLAPVLMGSGTAAAVGDFNRDGNLDLVTSEVGGGIGAPSQFFSFLGDGQGGFRFAAFMNIGSDTRALATGDFNRDGNLDVVAVGGGGSSIPGEVRVLLGNGAGGFTTEFHSYLIGDSPGSVAVADLNGDGKLDVVTGGKRTTLLLGDVRKVKGITKLFGAPQYLSVGGWGDVAVADFNHDAKLDIVRTNGDMLLGNGDGTFGDGTFGAGQSGGGTGESVAVGDFNGDSRRDLAFAYIGIVYLQLGNGDGTFASAQIVADQTGGAVAAGDFNRDGNLDVVTNTHLLLGNGAGVFTAQSYASGSGAALAVADFNGDHYPDLVAGSAVVLNAADWGTPPQTASQFLLSGPSSVAVGVSFNLTVTVVDADGNLVPGYAGTIRFTGGGSNATLPADHTFTASDSGTATFAGLVLRRRGIRTITVTDSLDGSLIGTLIVNVV